MPPLPINNKLIVVPKDNRDITFDKNKSHIYEARILKKKIAFQLTWIFLDNHDTCRYTINLLQVALNGHQQITSNPNTHKTKAPICQALILGKDDYAPL